MKELSIEEKAKRYDEAIDVCRKLYNKAKADGYTSDIEDYEDIFPELAESEDERIRKEIVFVLKNANSGENLTTQHSIEEMLAWLEKQGETFTKKDVDDAYLKGVSDTKQELEKQGESKKHDICDFCDQQVACVNPCCVKLVEKQGEQKDSVDRYYEGFKHGEECVVNNYGKYGLKKPVEWSEEDKGMLLEVKCLVDNLHSDGGNANYNTEELQEMWNWLDTIWQRVKYPQPKQGWSEEDEKCFKNVIDELVCVRNRSDRKYDYPELTRLINWLKSLRPNHWKPSLAQLNALSIVAKGNSPDDIEEIKSLLNDLKKLKG